MSERKVLNKYYPPDFDPSKIPRTKKPKNNQVTVRMMLPMSVRCNTCGEYIYKGKKFNSKKETVAGEEYLGVKIFRFYMRCTNCSAEFTIKTDPERSDYIAEMNCSRNFEQWRENEKLIEEIKKERKDEEEGDAMKALENRTLDSKVEMDILDALDEIRSLNARNAKIDSDTLIEAHKRTYAEIEQKLDEEDEEDLKSVVFKNSTDFVKRVEDEEEDGEEELPTKKLKQDDQPLTTPLRLNFIPTAEKKKEPIKPVVKPVVKVVPKVVPVKKNSSITATVKAPAASVSLVDY